MKIGMRQARKVLEVVDAGLVSGLGVAEPGKMCVEAAICYALGIPHSDNPTYPGTKDRCVGSAVRAYKIKLNDAGYWTSDASRAAGMRRLAVAQLGSETLDQVEFSRRLAVRTIQVIVPLALRAAASVHPVAAHRAALEAAAVRCEEAASADSADSAARAAWAASAASADSADSADRAASAARADSVLVRSADLALEVLREMKAPGVKLLDRIEASMKAAEVAP